MQFAKYCPECGVPTGGAEACPNCGAWTALATPDPRGQPAQSQTERAGQDGGAAAPPPARTYVQVPVWVLVLVLLLAVIVVVRVMFPEAFGATLPFVVAIAVVMALLSRRYL